MAFSEYPEVDDNSKRSEESVLRVKSILTQKNGFINREEAPDFGVDLDIELIMDGKKASALKFAVQIKSAAKLKTAKKHGEEFFAFSFETSRLHYLSKRDLGFGILVLYDESTQACYFEYVFDLIKRVEAFNPVKGWRAQQTVTVYIAPSQELTVASARHLHDQVVGLYTRHQLLLRDHGSRYDLPVFAAAAAGVPVPQVDFGNPTQVAELLEKFGGPLFNQQEFTMLLDLLTRLSTATISASPTLTFLAAVTYGQIGDLIEGEYYLAKCRLHWAQLDEESKTLLDFTRIRLDFLRGNLDLTAYASRIEQLAVKSSGELNGLVLRLNALYLTVIATSDWSGEQQLAVRIEDLFAQIKASALDERTQVLLSLYNSESLQALGSSVYLQEAVLLKAQEELRLLHLDPARTARVQRSIARLKQAKQLAHAAYQYARQQTDDHLRAMAAYYLSRYFLNTEFDLMILQVQENEPLTDQKEQQYITHLNLAGEAYNRFSELQLWKDGHQALATITELQSIFLLRYAKAIGTRTQAEILARMQELETKLGLPAFESVVTATHQRAKQLVDAPAAAAASTPEEYAHKLLLLHGLPLERLPHVVADLQNQAAFKKACRNSRIQLLTNVSLRERPETAYTEPVSYILRDQLTGQESAPSTDMATLLTYLSSFPESPQAQV